MRITLVNQYHRHGGAERCLEDLYRGYRARGHDVNVVVGKSTDTAAEQAAGITVLPPGRLEWLLQRGLHRLCGVTDTLLWSPLVRAVRHAAFTHADVVHFHNLHGGYFNFWALPLLARARRLVITLHDMFLLTGDCIYSGPCTRWTGTCGSCPVIPLPRGRRGAIGGRDLTRVNLSIKRAAFARVPRDRLMLVAPSRWLADLVGQSHLAGFGRRVIPNGIDLAQFSPRPPDAARRRLGLPEQELLLAAVAANWDNPHKGGELLLELAAAMSAQRLGRVVVAGRVAAATKQRLDQLGALVREGLQSADAVCDIFSACDGALVLSKEENLPFVVMEALACGCPVFGRRVGGISEMYEDGRHGWLLAAAAGTDGYLAGIRELALESPEQRAARRLAARAHATRLYGIQTMLDGYEGVYQELLDERRGIARDTANAKRKQ